MIQKKKVGQNKKNTKKSRTLWENKKIRKKVGHFGKIKKWDTLGK